MMGRRILLSGIKLFKAGALPGFVVIAYRILIRVKKLTLENIFANQTYFSFGKL